MFDPFCPCDDCAKMLKAGLAEDPFQTGNLEEKHDLENGEVIGTTAGKAGPLSQKCTVSRPPFFEYVSPLECTSWGSWFYSEWNFLYGWDGPYVQLREVGIRVCGLSLAWTKRWTGENDDRRWSITA